MTNNQQISLLNQMRIISLINAIQDSTRILCEKVRDESDLSEGLLSNITVAILSEPKENEMFPEASADEFFLILTIDGKRITVDEETSKPVISRILCRLQSELNLIRDEIESLDMCRDSILAKRLMRGPANLRLVKND